jgi:amidase
MPASFCGLYGIRTTHGAVPLDGAVALAPSYDTVGWFARDPSVFARVGDILLLDTPHEPATTLLIATDLFERAGPAITAALADGIRAIEARLGPARRVQTGGPDWREVFRLLQSAEAWAAHGPWVTATRPAFGPGVRERFKAASQLDPALVEAARIRRTAIATAMNALVPPGTLLLVPSAPGIAPRLDADAATVDAFRQTALDLLCPAGHAGLPQISLPLGCLDGCPVGLGVIAWRGGDAALLRIATDLAL